MSTQSSSVQHAFALNNEDTLTHISEVKRSDPYICPDCGNTLTPVLGKNNAKHFRHTEECCSLESYLHKCAKKRSYTVIHKPSIKHTVT